jgi:anti-anti-sigma factor
MGLIIDVNLTDDNIPVVKIQGEVDISSCPDLREALRKEIAQHRKQIVIDLSEASYLDSAGLGVLVDAERKAKLIDGSIYLSGASFLVQRALQITQLTKIFKIEASVEAALDKIRRNS